MERCFLMHLTIHIFMQYGLCPLDSIIVDPYGNNKIQTASRQDVVYIWERILVRLLLMKHLESLVCVRNKIYLAADSDYFSCHLMDCA